MNASRAELATRFSADSLVAPRRAIQLLRQETGRTGKWQEGLPGPGPRRRLYSDGPMQQFNFQDTYLRTALAFIGLNDSELITVEGGDFGAEAADRAVSNALAKVSRIAA